MASSQLRSSFAARSDGCSTEKKDGIAPKRPNGPICFSAWLSSARRFVREFLIISKNNGRLSLLASVELCRISELSRFLGISACSTVANTVNFVQLPQQVYHTERLQHVDHSTVSDTTNCGLLKHALRLHGRLNDNWHFVGRGN